MLGERLISGLFGNRAGNAYDVLVKAYTDQGKFSGAVLVARGGEVLFRKAYGLANREHNAPNTPETPFRIGSMTKPFTAIAIMQLAEKGVLSEQDSLAKYVPDYPHGERITLHHLMTNTSGIPDYIMMPEYEPIKKQHISTTELIAVFRDKPMQFEPGTDFGYSNSGWVLLGYVLELVTGKPYEQVIQQQIFAPSGMTHSGYEWEQPLIKGRPTGYADTGRAMLNAEFIDETTMHGAGGLYATVDDLLAFDRELHNGKLLKAETLAQMTLPASKTSYGYGWELYQVHNRKVVAHSGGMPGYVSNLARFVDDDVTVIILSNLGSTAFSQMTETLAAIAFGEPYALPTAHAFIDLDLAVMADYLGDYNLTYFGRASTLKFTIENGKLMMDVKGLPKTVASAISQTQFYARSKGDVYLTFQRDDDGQVNTIDVNWSGNELMATRIK
ncbi:MAG: serine hydrolase [Anaerolineae bacterium]|nr:serine hydrolase [Anaerolineae bacterium]